jgi:5'-nucleotidase
VGATQPISNFFGDQPTINALNMMGLSADTFGNHNFDYGQEYLRTMLIPLSQFPYLAANVVYPNDTYPPEWKPSHIFEFDGFKLGVIGYTLTELPQLIFPGYLDPFIIKDPATTVNAGGGQVAHQDGPSAIIAVGHLGADGGTVTSLISAEPADRVYQPLQGVDAVIGSLPYNISLQRMAYWWSKT